jgi:hypothetical protein
LTKISFNTLLLTLFSCALSAQTVQKVKFAKEPGLVYFFQEGVKSDTISKKTSNRFYFIAPDSLILTTTLSVENGQLVATGNDSILVCNYLPGLKYESVFYKKEDSVIASNSKKKYELKTMINGASSFERDKILIQIIDQKSNRAFIENVFFWK